MTLWQTGLTFALQPSHQCDLDHRIVRLRHVVSLFIIRTLRDYGLPCRTCETVISVVRDFEDEELGNMELVRIGVIAVQLIS